MFIQFGDRRINLSLVKEYKPIKKTSMGKDYYKISLKYLDGSSDELHFFQKEDERDDYIKKLDQNLLD